MKSKPILSTIIPLFFLFASVLMTGCKSRSQIYTVTYFDVFDTVTTVMGNAENEAAFQKQADRIHADLLHSHRLFDIYHDYGEISNLKTVNDQAGIAPVPVEPEILALLQTCRSVYDDTEGKVNVAMGSVLQLWHDARTAGIDDPAHAALPDADALQEARRHCAMEDVIVDEENATVFLRDPLMRLDVGAIAKGWAAQHAAEQAPEGFLLSVGGDIVATGPKDKAGTPWTVGIQDPDAGDGSYLATVSLVRGCAVTSGDYQRFYLVDGIPYHHIIDPDTLMPAELWHSVTVLCPDSAMADALSTALFLLPQNQGQALLDRFDAEALWIDGEGVQFRSIGFATYENSR